MPLRIAPRLMVENDVGALPVMDPRGRVVGRLSARNLGAGVREPAETVSSSDVRAAPGSQTAAGLPVGEVMFIPALVIHSEASVRDAARLMDGEHAAHLVVLDAEGRLLGIVSRGDLLRS